MWRMSSQIVRTRVLTGHLQRSTPTLTACRGKSQDGKTKTKAVIFDMGGVILPSPFGLFQHFEKEKGLPENVISKTIMMKGRKSAWALLEQGDLTPQEFGEVFSKEVSAKAGKKVDLTDLLGAFTSQNVVQNADMLDAVKCVRAEGLKTALLTNNWFSLDKTSYVPLDKTNFDVIVESCIERMRKPDPRIYRTVLERLQVRPEEAIFLDDLGSNLKPAEAMGIRTIKVDEDNWEAISKLEEMLGFSCRGYAPGTIAVPERLQLDIPKLTSYLNSTLNMHDTVPPVVRCYAHGQSNPTYFVKYANKNMVLRKKPPGKLLPSAHAVEREYKVMKAVRDHGVPVPKMLALCEETELLGTPFYIMEHVPGRIFKDPLLPGMTPEERKTIYAAMNDVLAKIHKVDIKAAGLEDYGKQGGYLKRNFNRWAKQYEASKTDEVPEMDQLMKWLEENMPQNEKCTIAHGDFRLDNLIFHPDRIEVVAVLDWELSTLGDPLTDLATNCMPYYLPSMIRGTPGFSSLQDLDLPSMGLPTSEQYVNEWCQRMGLPKLDNFEVYVAFVFFRMAAIVQGVYKRSLQGQASSPDAAKFGPMVAGFAGIGWSVATQSKPTPTPTPSAGAPTGRREYHTQTRSTAGFNMDSQQYSTASDRNIPGAMPLSVKGLSPRVQDIHSRIQAFNKEHIAPLEALWYDYYQDPQKKWTIHPRMEELKAKCKAEGLWNLFLPLESDPGMKHGAGLTNMEYAYLCEEMGKYPLSSEVFNCSAPDTGNMETLVRYGTEEQKKQWLMPLLEGKIRSCFGMTEPQVASSDATNIESSIKRQGDYYIINGRKWWTSGAMDPRCKLCIFMGKTSTDGPIHRQQSMILIPMDAPGVKIVRALSVFGSEDPPHGHAEMVFNNVKVPVSSILLGEGRGFEIAQGRLGPGRIHHCMRLIGNAERALELMVERVHNRVAFGKPLAAQGSIQQDIAKSRIEIEQCRLLVLKAAYMMDTVGNKVAAPEIAMIKVAAPNMCINVVDRAIQAHGGMGVCQDTILPALYAIGRVLRIADGPDEAHMRAITQMQYTAHNLAKL